MQGEKLDSEKKSVVSDFPIDAVITWVDGSDPQHAEKLNTYLASLNGERPRAASKARFHHAGEIDYCVTSLLKFAPWLRTIFIVTDDQAPEFMNTIKGSIYEERIKIIDHKVIFEEFKDCLPTFNSMAITSLLWKIPGIAERFIYFNDDFMLLRPVEPEDFFTENGVVLRGKWQQQPEASFWHRAISTIKSFVRSPKKKQKVSYWGLQQRCASLFGFDQYYFRLPHTPHPWRRSSWELISKQESSAILKNISARLRSNEQFVPESMSAHFELKNNHAVINNLRTNLQLKPVEQSYLRINYKLALADRNKNIVFGCIQSIELASPKKQQLIFTWLERRIGTLSDLCKK